MLTHCPIPLCLGVAASSLLRRRSTYSSNFAIKLVYVADTTFAGRRDPVRRSDREGRERVLDTLRSYMHATLDQHWTGKDLKSFNADLKARQKVKRACLLACVPVRGNRKLANAL